MEGYQPDNEKLRAHNERMAFVLKYLKNLRKEKREIGVNAKVIVLDKEHTYEPLYMVRMKENGMVQVKEAPDAPAFEVPLSDTYHLQDWNEAFETALTVEEKERKRTLS